MEFVERVSGYPIFCREFVEPQPALTECPYRVNCS